MIAEHRFIYKKLENEVGRRPTTPVAEVPRRISLRGIWITLGYAIKAPGGMLAICEHWSG